MHEKSMGGFLAKPPIALLSLQASKHCASCQGLRDKTKRLLDKAIQPRRGRFDRKQSDLFHKSGKISGK
jgi:hypothetical protein